MKTTPTNATQQPDSEAARSPALQRAGLAEPLSQLLDHEPSPNVRAANWAKISERLEPSPGAPRHLATAPSWRGWALALAAASLSVWLGVTLLGGGTPDASPLAQHPLTQQPAAQLPTAQLPTAQLPTTSGQASAGLRLEGGQAFVELDLPTADAAAEPAAFPQQPPTVNFEDGSSITAKPGTRVEALAMTERDVTLRLVRGSVDVHVVKGGPRRWTIEAGVLSVEVVGTKFSVERLSDRVGVRVTRGAVLVRSGELPERVERLAAGQELSVAVAAEPSAAAAPNPTQPSSQAGALGVDALLERADAARVAGAWSRARSDLENVVRQFPNDPRAGLAAYQLAGVREQQGAPASEVAQAFARALPRAHGSSLRQDCYWRLSQAQLRAGQSGKSRKTAEAALAEYPNGRYAERLQQHLDSLRSGPIDD